jgi:galactitol-specific phosphotransferase system IIB component
MIANTAGSLNTAVGSSALGMNTTAHFNTAFGAGALPWLASGNGNTAVGTSALANITFGINNTAIGYNSFQTSLDIGNSTAIGADAQILLSNQVQIGGATVQLIGGSVAWSIVSDGRFKNISEEEVKGLDFITRLKPVIYNFDTQKYEEFLLKNLPKEKRDEIMSKKDYSQSKAVVHSGFIAQEVEKAAEESGFDFNGVHHPENENDNYSIAYSLFTVPLVKAVQELNEKNEKQQILINTLLNETEHLKAELEAIKAMLAK